MLGLFVLETLIGVSKGCVGSHLYALFLMSRGLWCGIYGSKMVSLGIKLVCWTIM